MKSRLCGYCRQHGHMADKCPTKIVTIDTIRRHVGKERKAIADALIRSGYGAGAIVTAYNWHAGDQINCFITQESLDKVFEIEGHYVEYRTIKYSKRVRVSLIHKMTEKSNPAVDDVISYSKDTINMYVQPIESGMGHGSAYIPNWNLGFGVATSPDYRWHKDSELLVPSHDGCVPESALLRPFRLHERLGKASDGYGIFVTPILP